MTSASSTTASTWVAIDVAKLVHQVLIDGRVGRRRTMRIANTASEIERLVTHLQSFSLEQNMQSAIAKPCALRRVSVEASQHGEIQRTAPALIAPRRRAQPDHPTGATQTGAARPKPPHRLAPSDGADHFFATTAFSAWMSSVARRRSVSGGGSRPRPASTAASR